MSWQTVAQHFPLQKSPTGINGLDEITLGGLPHGRPTLVCGGAGCGKTLLAIEFLVHGALEYDEPGALVSLPLIIRQRSGELRMTDNTNKTNPDSDDEFWELRLYVAGQTPKSIAAFANLKKICEENLHGRYHIEIIDLAQNPRQARDDQIVVIPTLIRKLPEPLRKIIGDLSHTERVLVAMELRARSTAE